ncbi:MAG: hypothetical protein ACR65R_08140 [Methylomicrobium sp.]
MMTDADKLKIYSAMAETTRKWVSVMDTKAGFISALNAGMLAIMWSGAKLQNGSCWQKGLALSATLLSLISLFVALRVVLPRACLMHVFGHPLNYADGYKPISFYGFVATNYTNRQDGKFIDDVMKLDEAALAKEALEQHFTISHVVHAKSNLVAIAGLFLKLALLLASFALFSKVIL